MTQIRYKSKYDWINQVFKDLKDFKLETDFSYFQGKSISSFKTIIKSRAREFALNKFQRMQENHSKMRKLNYTDLHLQDYLTCKYISIETKKTLFRWRISMESFGKNFRGGREYVSCPLCFSHKDSQEESFNKCSMLRQEIDVKGCYNKLFEDISQHPELIDSIAKIREIRKRILNQD